MARDISVHKAVGEESLYDAPLGSEASVRMWWSAPAESTGLPLIASIYDHGFYHSVWWKGSELVQAESELVQLGRFWTTMGLSDAVVSDLTERAACLRAAIQAAIECDGFVDIS